MNRQLNKDMDMPLFVVLQLGGDYKKDILEVSTKRM